MKKQKKIRASGALVIFAVLFLLSACGIFTPYEPPVTAHFLINEDDTIQQLTMGGSKEVKVTLIKSSKIQDLKVTWKFDNGDVANVNVKTDDGTAFINGESVRKTTNFIFTISAIKTGPNDVLCIEVNNDSESLLDGCYIQITVDQ